MTDFQTFLHDKCRDRNNFRYLNLYCEMAEILFDSIKADREGDFILHLKSTRRKLPYFFPLNHPNYARGVTL